MEVINISPYCSAGHSQFYTNEKLGISNISYSYTYENFLVKMKNCFQFENVDMYEHGLMVSREYTSLLKSLKEGLISEVFPPVLIDLLSSNSTLDDELMLQYHSLHDCGKPLCREVDDDHRVRYPDHARISYEQIKKIFPEELDLQFLVLHDMDFHTLKPDELVELASSKYGFSLYLTAWSELMANARMFGGFDSVSFKIKRKKLIKCLKLFSS